MLRVWARGLLGLEAAVELLAGHRFWLRRGDFLAVAVEVDRDRATGGVSAWVDFEAAAAALRVGRLPCSSNQAQLLPVIAASLAADGPNVVAVPAAVPHAAGPGARPVLAGGGREGAGR